MIDLRRALRLTRLATVCILSSGPAFAQGLDVPVVVPAGDGQAADCASSVVAGLDPNGDGFLAVRSGPGAEFRKIDELVNGDVVFPCDARGDWAGVVYRPRGQTSGPATKSGWVHRNWLRDLAG